MKRLYKSLCWHIEAMTRIEMAALGIIVFVLAAFGVIAAVGVLLAMVLFSCRGLRRSGKR